MNEIQLAFYELFFGLQGGWIGFLLVASACMHAFGCEKERVKK